MIIVGEGKMFESDTVGEPLMAVGIDLREVAAAVEGRCGGNVLPNPPENIFLSLIVEGEDGLVEIRLSREDVAFVNRLIKGKSGRIQQREVKDE